LDQTRPISAKKKAGFGDRARMTFSTRLGLGDRRQGASSTC
jgi:hypothetical protein